MINIGISFLISLLKKSFINQSQHEKYLNHFSNDMKQCNGKRIALSSYNNKDSLSNIPENFVTKFNRPLTLDGNYLHAIGLNRIINMSLIIIIIIIIIFNIYIAHFL